MKMSFRRATYQMSQFKRFSDLDITKKLGKENTGPKLIAYSTESESTRFFL